MFVDQTLFIASSELFYFEYYIQVEPVSRDIPEH